MSEKNVSARKKSGIVVAFVVVVVAVLMGSLKLHSMYKNVHQKLDVLLQDQSVGETPLNVNDGVFEIKVNGNQIFLDMNKDQIHDCYSLNTEFPTTFEFSENLQGDIYLNGSIVEDLSNCSIQLEQLKMDEFIELEINDHLYQLRTLPIDFPQFVVEDNTDREGYYYFGNMNYLIKADSDFNIVFYRKSTATPSNFKRFEFDGEIFYTYTEPSPSVKYPRTAVIGVINTDIVILDEHYNVCDMLTSLAEDEKIPDGFPIESHEVQMLGKGHYLISAYLPERVYIEGGPALGTLVITSVIQEVKDGQSVFVWKSSDHPELYNYSVESNDYTNTVDQYCDYAHINAYYIDPKDNNILASFRNFDAILKIDRDTGDIIWTLGGLSDDFGLTQDQLFGRQHNITVLEDGSYFLYDNGIYMQNSMEYWVDIDAGLPQGQYNRSRALRFLLDEESKQVVEFNEYSLNNYYGRTQGSSEMVDLATETVLIGWGGHKRSTTPLFTEIDYSQGKVLMNVYGAVTDSENTTEDIYRVHKFDK